MFIETNFVTVFQVRRCEIVSYVSQIDSILEITLQFLIMLARKPLML